MRQLAEDNRSPRTLPFPARCVQKKKKKKLNKKGQCDLGSHPFSVEARFKSPVFMTERDALSPRLLVLQTERKIEFTEVHGTCQGDA